MTGNIFSELLDALRVFRAPGRDGDEAGDYRILFPRLEVLAVPIESESAHSVLLVGLIDLIRARQDHGAPLRQLVIPTAAEHWAVWSTLRTMLKITPIDYPTETSPLQITDDGNECY